MKKPLKNLTTEELGRLFPVILTDKNKHWKKLFEEERSILLKLLSDFDITKITHFGSTAIPKMVTKSTVDILIEIPKSQETRKQITQRMLAAGYNHMDNHPTHIMFVKGYNPTGVEEVTYHIHMGSADESQLWDRIYFRDYLIDNPDVAFEYAKLKKKLAIKYKYNRELYTEGKEEFIKRITEIAKEKIQMQ